ncbi:zinc-binding alcohol dehydrogenase family protein [Pseudoflavitalea rhizosphaerae]|uniref:zinc-binding alcohol dehydrogenase family protein n=1 Tax=Pseudoflavitalea rhizosphaerae TaxID=1884793 RepID=UPI000F8E8A44|nr:zinc-binding alcohol dehydrogenase family protein [Pseudoflavitalea rhizosphaerae]
MKFLSCQEPGKLEYGTATDPIPQEGHVIIKVKHIGVCGTDLHAYEGTQPYFTYPRILGHEIAGELADNNGITDLKVGEAVTIVPYFSCGHCIACRSGAFNCCVSIKVFGVHIDGGMQEYISVPANSLVKGEGLSLQELALTEPLAIGAHAVQRAAISPGNTVVVCGAGAIGLGIMEMARLAGATIIAIDVNERRLEFCREKTGVTHTIHAGRTNAVEAVSDITSGDMSAIVFDATGNLQAIEKGLQYLAHSGKYILVGLQKQAFSFSHPEFHKRETTLMSSRNALRKDFEAVVLAIRNKKIDPASFITHTVQFSEVANNFESWLKPESGVIKPMVRFD